MQKQQNLKLPDLKQQRDVTTSFTKANSSKKNNYEINKKKFVDKQINKLENQLFGMLNELQSEEQSSKKNPSRTKNFHSRIKSMSIQKDNNIKNFNSIINKKNFQNFNAHDIITQPKTAKNNNNDDLQNQSMLREIWVNTSSNKKQDVLQKFETDQNPLSLTSNLKENKSFKQRHIRSSTMQQQKQSQQKQISQKQNQNYATKKYQKNCNNFEVDLQDINLSNSQQIQQQKLSQVSLNSTQIDEKLNNKNISKGNIKRGIRSSTLTQQKKQDNKSLSDLSNKLDSLLSKNIQNQDTYDSQNFITQNSQIQNQQRPEKKMVTQIENISKFKRPQIQKKKDTKLNILAEKNVEKNYDNVEQLIDDVRGEFENFEHDCIQMMEQVLGDLDDIKKYNKNEKIEELSTQFKSLKSRYTQSQKILPSHQKSENNKQYQQIIDQQDQIDYIDLDKDYELKEQYLKDISNNYDLKQYINELDDNICKIKSETTENFYHYKNISSNNNLKLNQYNGQLQEKLKDFQNQNQEPKQTMIITKNYRSFQNTAKNQQENFDALNFSKKEQKIQIKDAED